MYSCISISDDIVISDFRIFILYLLVKIIPYMLSKLFQYIPSKIIQFEMFI